MKLILLFTGKTQEKYLREGMQIYIDRLKHYVPTEVVELKTPVWASSFKPEQIRQKESEWVLQNLPDCDFLVLLDESGKQISSSGLADFLQARLNQGIRQLVFLVGGSYGVSEDLRKKSQYVLSLSLMTFTHQMTRLLLSEQLYRAFTILRGEPYHNP